MDIFNKCNTFTGFKEAIKRGIYPYFPVLNAGQDTETSINGNKTMMLGSNNYLGLTSDERVKKAAQDALAKYGTGSAGSRFLNGTLDLHVELEDKLASFLNKDGAIVFSTGFQANLGVIATIAGRNDYIISDKANHASILDGCHLSLAKLVRYKHSDMDDLERILKKIPEDKGKIIITDGVFSMEGDICKLPEIVELGEKYGARIMVDDAHGVGVLGDCGRGTANHFGLEDKVDIIVGSLSKALASLGGFMVANKEVTFYIKHIARSFIFSTSVTPADAASALEAVKILEKEPERVKKLWDNTNFMREGFRNLGLTLGNSMSPIIPVMTWDDNKTFAIGRKLLEHGIFVNSVVSPAVNKGEAILRTTYSSTHTKKQLEYALEIFDKVFKEEFGEVVSEEFSHIG